jgi:hypothetical protein
MHAKKATSESGVGCMNGVLWKCDQRSEVDMANRGETAELIAYGELGGYELIW